MFENLGIIYDHKMRVKNHRSVLKVIFNPFLRHFGYNIATKYDETTDKLNGITFVKSSKVNIRDGLKFKYKLSMTDFIVKKRIWW